MDRLKSMQVFVAAVEAGSMTAAAESLRLSAPMVGKHIRDLEDRLGTRLLIRTTRRQRLSEFGRHYFEQCRAILDQIADVERGAQALHETPRGTLRISAPVNHGSIILAPLVAEFLRHHPQLRAELILDDRFVDLVDEDFDIAVRVGPLADSSLVARRLSDYRLAICAAPSYLARMGMPRRPEDLGGHEVMDFTRWSRRAGWRLGQADPAPDAVPAGRLVSNNGMALRMAAVASFGLIMQPHALLREDIAAGRLVEVLQDYLPPPAPVHAVYVKERRLTLKHERFVTFLCASLPAPRGPAGASGPDDRRQDRVGRGRVAQDRLTNAG